MKQKFQLKVFNIMFYVHRMSDVTFYSKLKFHHHLNFKTER